MIRVHSVIVVLGRRTMKGGAVWLSLKQMQREGKAFSGCRKNLCCAYTENMENLPLVPDACKGISVFAQGESVDELVAALDDSKVSSKALCT